MANWTSATSAIGGTVAATSTVARFWYHGRRHRGGRRRCRGPELEPGPVGAYAQAAPSTSERVGTGSGPDGAVTRCGRRTAAASVRPRTARPMERRPIPRAATAARAMSGSRATTV